jgi:hypothetical protein
MAITGTVPEPRRLSSFGALSNRCADVGFSLVNRSAARNWRLRCGFRPGGFNAFLHGGGNARPPLGKVIWSLRESDLASCESLYESIHGHTRTNEIRDALTTGAPIVALRDGRLRAYMMAPRIWLANFGVAETEEDMQALLLGASWIAKQSISFLIPLRRAGLFRWCLTQGFRAIRPMTLMTIGEYCEPRGSYIPSVLY